MDKKTVAIFILSLIIIGFLVWTFGFRNPDYKETKRLLNSSIERNTIIEESAGRLQTANTKLIDQLEEERNIITGLQTAKQESDRINTELEYQNREQRQIIDSIRSGDTDIDDTISRAEKGIISALGYAKELTAGK